MPLPSGTRLGPYEIAAPLGAGGMGEVYRATDTSLGREVAVKVLPDAFAQDPERLARFEREARTLASLNHPNIAIVHGFEKTAATAAGQATVHALVMELVEGEDLSQAIARGRISIAETWPIAKQIAAALEAAHEQGIVHRDLKPANVKVTPDGHVKVLDFGLAKAMETAEPKGSAPQAATITTPAMTQAGMILGTAAYMSPEQAKGRPTDKRSDVWAYGCVLYEMLTGQRAFAGEDVSDTLASILKSDPDWTALPADTPPAIRTLIERCLIKDRRQRIADLSVASFVLAEARALDTPGTPQAPVHTGSRASGRRWLAPLAAGIGASALVAFGAWSMRPEPTDRPVARFSITLAEDERITTPARQLVALSPNGRRMTWVGAGRVLIRSVSEFDAQAVAGIDAAAVFAATPVFSPDGEALAFFSLEDRTLRRVALSGGAPVMICAVADTPRGMSWDSSAIVYGQVAGIFRCNANGGQPERLTTVESDESVYGPQILPGGQSLLFTIAKDADGPERWDKARIVVQSLASGERRTLVEGGSDARYLPTGHLLYALGGSLFAVPFDPAQLVTTGGAVSVLEGVRRSSGATTGAAHFATSDSGTLVYVPGPARPTSSFAVVMADRTGSMTPLKLPPGRYVHVRASRDGRLLAVDTDDGQEANISTFELSGVSAMRRLTFGGRNRLPVWAPDGRRIAFQSDRDGDLAIFAQRIDGTGVERLTKPGQGEAHVPESWSPDGRHLSFAVQKGEEFTLWTLALADGKVTRFGDVLSRDPIGSVFSPDGRWIAYHTLPPGASPTSGNSGVFVEPFPPNGALYQAPRVSRDFQPVWSRDGAALIYVGSAVSGQAAAVPVTVQSGITFGPVATFPFVANAGRLSGATRAFDVLPNNTFVGVAAESVSERATGSPEIRVVLNWFEELKRMVPLP